MSLLIDGAEVPLYIGKRVHCGIILWTGISLDGHIDVHVCHGETLNAVIYRDEILAPYSTHDNGAIGDEFILTEYNI